MVLYSFHRVTLPLPVFFCFNAGVSHIPSKQLLLHVDFCIIGLRFGKAGLSRKKKTTSRGMCEGKPSSPWELRLLLGSKACGCFGDCVLRLGRSRMPMLQLPLLKLRGLILVYR